MSRTPISQKTIDDYARGICEHIENPGFFCTETFRKKTFKLSSSPRCKVSKAKVIGSKSIRKVIGRLWNLMNDECAGRKTRARDRNLKMVMIVEGLPENPHIHLITESHPRLSKDILEDILKKASPRTSRKAIKVKQISNFRRLSGYLAKEINPENLVAGIEFFGPRERKS